MGKFLYKFSFGTWKTWWSREEMKNVSSEEGASWLDGGKSLLINNGVPRSKYPVSHNSRMKLSQNVPGRVRDKWDKFRNCQTLLQSVRGNVFRKVRAAGWPRGKKSFLMYIGSKLTLVWLNSEAAALREVWWSLRQPSSSWVQVVKLFFVSLDSISLFWSRGRAYYSWECRR